MSQVRLFVNLPLSKISGRLPVSDVVQLDIFVLSRLKYGMLLRPVFRLVSIINRILTMKWLAGSSKRAPKQSVNVGRGVMATTPALCSSETDGKSIFRRSSSHLKMEMGI